MILEERDLAIERSAPRRVALMQPYIPEYSLRFFDGLVSTLDDRAVVLRVYHSPTLSQARQRRDVEEPWWSVSMKAREFVFLGRMLTLRPVPRAATSSDLLILEQAIGKIEVLRLLLPRRRPIAMLGHGHIHNRRTSAWERAMIQGLTRRCDWFFAYTESASTDAQVCGVPRDRITVFRNSSDTRTLATHRRVVSDSDVAEFRRRHALDEHCDCLLLLGSIDDSKRPEFLIAAMRRIWGQRPSTVLLIVGDGDARDRLQTAGAGVRSLGRLTGRELATAAAASTAIVMPGRVGLVATDSFALELPIVTTAWPYHSPEFAYLDDGVNARITDDEVNTYADGVIELMTDPALAAKLRSGCRESAKLFSTEDMVERFADGVLRALNAGVARRESWFARAGAVVAPGCRRLAKRLVSRVGPLRRALLTSTDYELGTSMLAPASGWSEGRAVRRQRRAWERVTESALNGDVRGDVEALWSALSFAPAGATVLEVGAGHGFIAQLIRHQRPDFSYIGFDISIPMVESAAKSHTWARFVVADATKLPVFDGASEVVLDAATLMHVSNWRLALKEEARCSRSMLVLHSVTVTDESSAAIPMSKLAYGARVAEHVLSSKELQNELESLGFDVERRLPSIDYDLESVTGVRTRSETWVCRRSRA